MGHKNFLSTPISLPRISEQQRIIAKLDTAFAEIDNSERILKDRLNAIVIKTIANLSMNGVDPPIWRSGNAPGGDEANARFVEKFKSRVKAL